MIDFSEEEEGFLPTWVGLISIGACVASLLLGGGFNKLRKVYRYFKGHKGAKREGSEEWERAKKEREKIKSIHEVMRPVA